MTASATAPPALHKKVSRLPWTHRVSLEPHTDREYAQKQKIMTTLFSGFSRRPIGILPMPAAHTLGSTVLRWRFPGEFFENAIELRKRLKPSRERDFTDA